MSSGLFSQLGLSKESVYGTRVVPAKFYEFRSEGLSFDQRYFISNQIGAGSTFSRSSRRQTTTRSAGGPVVMEVPNKTYGSILDLMHDNVTTPVQQGGTIAYLQTHNIGLTAPGKSATLQVGRPDTSGVVRPFDYLGCMLTEVEYGWDVDDALVATHTFDAQNEDTAQTLATRSLATSLQSFVFTQGSLSIAGSQVADVTSGSLNISFARQTDFYPLGTTGLKSKPLQNAISGASGTATVRFTDLTHYNRYKNNTIPTLALDFVGAANGIVAGHAFEFHITCNAVGFTGETPKVGGPDVLMHAIPFDVLYDGTNAPVIITYKSTDVTI